MAAIGRAVQAPSGAGSVSQRALARMSWQSPTVDSSRAPSQSLAINQQAVGRSTSGGAGRSATSENRSMTRFAAARHSAFVGASSRQTSTIASFIAWTSQ